ncbi:MAG: transglutaminase domain-containing protein, partial [Candidatus Zixiibacteriota bacterium]
RWVHTRVRHDGSSTNPSPANALHIIDVCDKEGRGVNCRMLGTTLNEVYLAMGFKSRHLTCLPYDTLDQDCHVINMVWSTQFNKWIGMDPTNDAYWMDINHTPLSPWEVRRAMERGDSLVLSDSINWNGQPQSRQSYYNYIAKNSFRFMAPGSSSYGYESNAQVIEVGLYPTDYRPDLIGKSDSTRYKGIIYEYSDDPDWFFAPPK